MTPDELDAQTRRRHSVLDRPWGPWQPRTTAQLLDARVDRAA